MEQERRKLLTQIRDSIQRPRTRFGIIATVAIISATIYLAVSKAKSGFGFPLDDAWIHQTYARNLANLAEWSFIPGTVSGGSTSPLWTILLTIGHWLHLFIPWTLSAGDYLPDCPGNYWYETISKIIN